MMFFRKSPVTSNRQPAMLLVGLGNPGPEYAGNRHNIGFMAVDQIAGHYHFPAFKKKFSGLLAEGAIGDTRVFLLKPLTYMNLSGEAVASAANFYKIPPEKIIVFHDELDLPLGKLRVKQGGGHGGHNGLKSIDAHIGKDYHRVRLGIAHPGDKNLVSDYVLSDFSKTERKIIDPMIAEISQHLPLLLAGDMATYMNRISIAAGESPTTNHQL
ncbi:MAG: aminoacyl-tRNA hydrolase [Rickettsiales bacterium]|jgi:PTH1 family peptidyl-tRNA hydrolase|nr:aminoacyl-tRNA hydrolase [Rickettsiales bacterium]